MSEQELITALTECSKFVLDFILYFLFFASLFPMWLLMCRLIEWFSNKDFEEKLEYWLDSENQQAILKQAYYDRSYKESTLERLQKDIKRIECQREEWGTNEYPLEELKRLEKSILKDDYIQTLISLPERERSIDDWHYF